MADATGIARNEVDQIVSYLADKGLIQVISMGVDPKLSIIADGTDYVERALEAPNEPTPLFPPVTIMNIEGGVHHSQIQQGTVASRQKMETEVLDAAQLTTLVADMRRAATTLKLAPETRADLNADIDTIETQARRPTRSRAILLESFRSAKAIFERAGAVLIAEKLADLLKGS